MPLEIIVPETEPELNSMPGNLDQLKADLTAATTTPAAAPNPLPSANLNEPTPEPEPASELPEKFRGKTLDQVVDMYQNLERFHGQQSNELGQQRKMIDELLELKRSDDLSRQTPPEAQLPEVTAADLLDNPNEVLDRAIDARLSRFEETLNNIEVNSAKTAFENKYGNADQITASPEFQQWVRASPYRRQRALQAYEKHDYTAADELLTDFTLDNPVGNPSQSVTTPPAPSHQSPYDNPAAAILESSHSNSNDVTPPAGKIYRRLDLMRLRMQDPEGYNDPAFQSEIVRAYQEGRVK